MPEHTCNCPPCYAARNGTGWIYNPDGSLTDAGKMLLKHVQSASGKNPFEAAKSFRHPEHVDDFPQSLPIPENPSCNPVAYDG